MFKRLVKNAKAVSPIIATLMLVLISVGAAGAFYVWQSGWQSDVTKKAGGADIHSSLSIAGSTTVYPFTAVGVELYQAANPNVKIDYQAGGSGAGVASVGTGAVDIGSASRTMNPSESALYPDLNKDGKKDLTGTMVQTLIGYDAVVIVVPSANTHGLVSMNETVLRCIYYVNGGASPLPADVIAAQAWMPHAGAKYNWTEIFNNTGITTPTWKCTGAQTITLYDRQEESGTEETFAKDMLDCGQNTLEAAGINVGHYTGNQDLLNAIAGNADAFGFMSYGYAKATTSGVKMLPFQGDADYSKDGVKDIVDPNKMTSGDASTNDALTTSFEPGIRLYGTTFYDGSRNLYYITVNQPTGTAQSYIDFVLEPRTNMDICLQSGYISLYS
jgi:phosphate transport system substrate-binding protein